MDDAVNIMQEAHSSGVALVTMCAQETAEVRCLPTHGAGVQAAQAAQPEQASCAPSRPPLPAFLLRGRCPPVLSRTLSFWLCCRSAGRACTQVTSYEPQLARLPYARSPPTPVPRSTARACDAAGSLPRWSRRATAAAQPERVLSAMIRPDERQSAAPRCAASQCFDMSSQRQLGTPAELLRLGCR